MSRHIHADLIIEWAETGCDIQYKLPDGINWCDSIGTPEWSEKLMYRKKPQVIKYKRYLRKFDSGKVLVDVHCDDYMTYPPFLFVKWIDEDWQEVEI